MGIRVLFSIIISSFLIAQDIELETQDGKTVILHPDRTWEYKDTFGKNKDVLVLQNGTKYEGTFKSKDEKSVTFHVDGMPAAQTLPMSMVISVTLLDGNELVNNSKDEDYLNDIKARNAKSQNNNDDRVISYEQLMDVESGKSLSTMKNYSVYKTKNDSKISIGDTLKLGKPFGDNTRYDKSFGKEYRGFTYIIEGTPLGGIFLASDGMPLLAQKFQDSEVIVKQMNIYYSKVFGKSKMLLREIVVDPDELIGNRTVYDFEGALETGEVINPKAPLTKEQAIKKLKGYKELLDLELIYKEDYDKHKKELTPIIIGK